MKKAKKTGKKEAQSPKLAPALRTPTRSWFLPGNPPVPADKDRRDGLADFLTWLKRAPKAERDRCILDPCYAKEKFAEWGSFYREGDDPSTNYKAIPASTVFRLFEKFDVHRAERDKQVILILPDDSTDEEPTNQVWRCTYSPYLGGFIRKKKGP